MTCKWNQMMVIGLAALISNLALSSLALAAGKKKPDPDQFDLVCQTTWTNDVATQGDDKKTNGGGFRRFRIDLKARKHIERTPGMPDWAMSIKSASDAEIALRNEESGDAKPGHNYYKEYNGFDRKTGQYAHTIDRDTGDTYWLTDEYLEFGPCDNAPFTPFSQTQF